MPHYFFHLHNGLGFTRDGEGAELPDIAAAREKAIIEARAILAEDLKAGLLDLRGRIEITDSSDSLLTVVTFQEVVQVRTEDKAA